MAPARSAPDPLDWSLAVRVGGMVAGSGPAVPAAARAGLRRDLVAFTDTADELVRSFTGLEPPGPSAAPKILDRAGWIRANVQGFRGLLAPIGEKLGDRGGPGRAVARKALGLQIGVLLGYLAQKVLGQYDLFLAGEARPGAVYYVGPNIAAAEARAGLSPRDFRLWIALHEVTHRTQFTSVPWLRGHIKELVGGYLGGVDLDPKRMREVAARAVEAVRKGPAALRDGGLFTLFLSPDQREIVQRMQSLMTVVEGHGNFVMNRVGAEHIPTHEQMRRALAQRRAQAGIVGKAIERALAIDLKYQQYEKGERFIRALEERGGMDAVNTVWRDPESLPTAAEIADPDEWLARVGMASVDGAQAPTRPGNGHRPHAGR